MATYVLFSKMLQSGESNPAPFTGDYNYHPMKSDVPAEPHVARDGKMVELEDDGNGAVEIRGNQEEVGCILDLCEVKVCLYQQTNDEQAGSTSRRTYWQEA